MVGWGNSRLCECCIDKGAGRGARTFNCWKKEHPTSHAKFVSQRKRKSQEPRQQNWKQEVASGSSQYGPFNATICHQGRREQNLRETLPSNNFDFKEQTEKQTARPGLVSKSQSSSPPLRAWEPWNHRTARKSPVKRPERGSTEPCECVVWTGLNCCLENLFRLSLSRNWRTAWTLWSEANFTK